MLRIGVDVGGTNTDGVLIDVSRLREPTRGVLAHYKSPTTPDVSTGIEIAVRRVLEEAALPPSDVSSVSIGTTAFINAVLEADARRLAKVAVIRLCGPYTRQCPPFVDFPKRLRTLTEGHIGYVDGGFEIDGREILPLNEQQIKEQCALIKEKGLVNIVLSGIYSPLDNDGKHEVAARAIIQRELGPAVNVVCSRDVGQVGLLERENAAILNASILTFAQRTIRGFQRAIRALKLDCPLFLTQNDGTLTTAAAAARLPIRTFASGPTNSMRGAAFLAGLDDSAGEAKGERRATIVVDVGGTTSDVGVLLHSGFPRVVRRRPRVSHAVAPKRSGSFCQLCRSAGPSISSSLAKGAYLRGGAWAVEGVVDVPTKAKSLESIADSIAHVAVTGVCIQQTRAQQGWRRSNSRGLQCSAAARGRLRRTSLHSTTTLVLSSTVAS